MTSSVLYLALTRHGGTRWCSWLRHCATSQKVAGSIPDGVVGIFHWHNPSSHTMALGLTQPLKEMTTRNISCGVKATGAWGWQPYHLLGASTSWNPQSLPRPVMGLLFFIPYMIAVMVTKFRVHTHTHFCCLWLPTHLDIFQFILSDFQLLK